MKAMCVNTKGMGWEIYLTKGKIYDIHSIKEDWCSGEDICFEITNDRGVDSFYTYGRFVVTLEEYRQSKIELIIN